MTFQNTPRPTYSMWGPVQHAEELAPGIWEVSTAGHGGLILSPERLAAMPESWRRTPYSRDGQFEEDADWCIPILAFDKEFAKQRRHYYEEGKTTLDYAIAAAKGCHEAIYNEYDRRKPLSQDGFFSRFD